MWTMFYFVTFIGVFILTINCQHYDIEKMEKCPCAGDVIGALLKSVNNNDFEDDNGQLLKLRLWQQIHDNCTAHVLNKSPKPGQIEISMVYHGSVHAEERGQGQNVGDQNENVDIGRQQDVDFGQQEVYNGQQQEADYGQQEEEAYNVQQQEENNEEQQQEFYNRQKQEVDNRQQQEVYNRQEQEVDNGQQHPVNNEQQQEVDNGQRQQAAYNGQQQEVDNEQQQVVDNGQQQEVYNRQQEFNGQQQQGIGSEQQQADEDTGSLQDEYYQMLASIDLEQLEQSMQEQQQVMDAGQEHAILNTAQKQSQISSGQGNEGENSKHLAMEFFFKVDVASGKLTDSTSPIATEKRRKREIMPFDEVTIRIKIQLEQKQESNVGVGNVQTKLLLRNALDDYWKEMTFCLLDVHQ